MLANYALTRSPLRRLRTMSASGQFAAALSAMLSAGLPMPKALSVAGEVSGNYMFALAAGKVRQSVERGRTVAEGMGEVKLFPPMLREMIGVGESSGTLVDTLDVVAQYFNSEVETITNRLLAVLEPVITIGLAVIVMVLLLAVYMGLAYLGATVSAQYTASIGRAALNADGLFIMYAYEVTDSMERAIT